MTRLLLASLLASLASCTLGSGNRSRHADSTGAAPDSIAVQTKGTGPNADLAFSARITIDSMRINVFATATNTSTHDVRVASVPCAVSLLAYRSGHPTDKPVWDSNLAKPFGVPNGEFACPAYGIVPHLLAAGAQLTMQPSTSAFAIKDFLADSLSPGRYYFVAKVTLSGATVRVPAGAYEVGR